MSASRVIGGVFGLPEPGAGGGPLPALDDPRTILLVNGRSAIDLILRSTGATRVWLPSYICISVVEAVGPREICWYDVGDALTPRDEDWLDAVRPGDIVLFVNYFGWRASVDWYGRVAARGAMVVEDGSQSLLTADLGEGANFHFTVPRKFVGVPDGALLVPAASAALAPAAFAPAADDWWHAAHAVNAERREFDRGGASRDWFAAFGAVEAKQPLGPIAISDFSRELLRQGFDFGAIAATRRANFATLASALDALALFPSLPAGVVPIGFPIRLADRDQQRRRLFEHGIFPPVHWDIAGIVPDRFAASHRLSHEIMTLPCDQRYDRSDMERIIGILSQ